ncbi:MAG: PTS sugar transporter subunit IIA [Deltaproteobacteria bacterium]
MLEQVVGDRIVLSLEAGSKREALQELANTASAGLPDLSRDKVLQVLQERENLGSTGIGEGIAIPHGKLKGIDRIVICFGRSRTGVPFDAVDGKPVHLFFVLLTPLSAAREYLHTLAQLSRFLKNPSVRVRLLQAGSAEELNAIFREAPWD